MIRKSLQILAVALITPALISSAALASSKGGYGGVSGGYDDGYRNRSYEPQSNPKAALKKYDPVAYFKQGQAVRGKSYIKHDWDERRWYFDTKANRDLFAANPRKYAPQYDGFCAYAVSQGSLAKSNPKVWAIVDDKLYLNLNTGIQKRWDKNRSQYIADADKKWPSLRP